VFDCTDTFNPGSCWSHRCLPPPYPKALFSPPRTTPSCLTPVLLNTECWLSQTYEQLGQWHLPIKPQICHSHTHSQQQPGIQITLDLDTGLLDQTRITVNRKNKF